MLGEGRGTSEKAQSVPRNLLSFRSVSLKEINKGTVKTCLVSGCGSDFRRQIPNSYVPGQRICTGYTQLDTETGFESGSEPVRGGESSPKRLARGCTVLYRTLTQHFPSLWTARATEARSLLAR